MYHVNFNKPITVSELRKLLSDWPDLREDGTPTEVHFKSDGYGVCEAIAVLDYHEHDSDDNRIGDLVLSPFDEGEH